MAIRKVLIAAPAVGKHARVNRSHGVAIFVEQSKVMHSLVPYLTNHCAKLIAADDVARHLGNEARIRVRHRGYPLPRRSDRNAARRQLDGIYEFFDVGG